jgi:hypothetical protein
LKLYPDNRWVFAESVDPDYDFMGRIAALGLDRAQSAGDLIDGKARLCWGRYKRGKDVAALNWSGQVVGRLADALEDTDSIGVPFQVEVVGPGQLQPTTHDAVLTFVADEPA